MNKINLKEIKSYLIFWIMFAIKCRDEKTYIRHRDEMISHWTDKIGRDIAIANVEHIEKNITKSFDLNSFFKQNKVPNLYLFNIKEREHEKFIDGRYK